jgi:hypothetical protein
VVQNCAADPASCFGKANVMTYQVKAITGVANALGVNVQPIAQAADGIWDTVKSLF